MSTGKGSPFRKKYMPILPLPPPDRKFRYQDILKLPIFPVKLAGKQINPHKRQIKPFDHEKSEYALSLCQRIFVYYNPPDVFL